GGSRPPRVEVGHADAGEEGGQHLSFDAAPPPPYRAGPAWITYVYLPARGEVLQQVAAPDPEGGTTVMESRVVATGVVRVAVERVADGVAIEAKVRRGHETAEARAVATPRNP